MTQSTTGGCLLTLNGRFKRNLGCSLTLNGKESSKDCAAKTNQKENIDGNLMRLFCVSLFLHLIGKAMLSVAHDMTAFGVEYPARIARGTTSRNFLL
jgi:hypothetical protein